MGAAGDLVSLAGSDPCQVPKLCFLRHLQIQLALESASAAVVRDAAVVGVVDTVCLDANVGGLFAGRFVAKVRNL